jgi:hypothetical protein
MMKVLITVLCGIILAAGCTRKQPAGTTHDQTQEKAESKYSIKPVEVDGKDVATALGLYIYKFQCRMPKGTYRTLCWAEIETKGDDAITKKDIANMWGTIKDGIVLIKMPAPNQKGVVFGIGGSYAHSPEFSIPLTGWRGWSMNKAIPDRGANFEPGNEVMLVEYLAADANGMSGSDHFDHRVRVKMIIEPEDKPS